MASLLPPVIANYAGEPRCVGVEVEFAGVPPQDVLAAITSLYGGEIEEAHMFEYRVTGTSLGSFKLELDSSQLQALGEALSSSEREPINETIEAFGLPLLSKAAEAFVPWEVVTDPIEISNLTKLIPLISSMQQAGALGTRHAVHFAFGLHFNPDVPDLSVNTILRYLRAYFCLYDWIRAKEDINWTRTLSPYIRHFKNDYIRHILAPSYKPTIELLIDDYLAFNPTRNRSLDMLPLFAFIDENRVRNKVSDDRIKPRPTFHYRLPNCDIDNPNWNIDYPWSLWLQVEKLACNTLMLNQLCEKYLVNLDRLTASIDGQWLETLNTFMKSGENT